MVPETLVPSDYGTVTSKDNSFHPCEISKHTDGRQQQFHSQFVCVAQAGLELTMPLNSCFSCCHLLGVRIACMRCQA